MTYIYTYLYILLYIIIYYHYLCIYLLTLGSGRDGEKFKIDLRFI